MQKFIAIVVLFFFSAGVLALSVDEDDQTILEKKLRTTEIAISNLTLEMENTKKQLTIEKKKIDQLAIEENHLTQKLEKQKDLLKQQIVLAYRLNDNSMLQTLLSHKNLSEQEKTNTYIRHLNQSQFLLTQQVAQTLTTLGQTKEELQIRLCSLEKLYDTQKAKQHTLERTYEARKRLLDSF